MRELKQAFRDPPPCVDQAVLAGFAAGRRAGSVKKRAMLACCAAAAAVMLVLAGFLAFPRPVPDAALANPPGTEYAYAGQSDEMYHKTGLCPNATGRMVRLPTITAREFGKKPCPVCEDKK